jgi:hypothetical protein
VVKSSNHKSLPFSVDLTVEKNSPQALAKAAIAQALNHFSVALDVGIFGGRNAQKVSHATPED